MFMTDPLSYLIVCFEATAPLFEAQFTLEKVVERRFLALFFELLNTCSTIDELAIDGLRATSADLIVQMEPSQDALHILSYVLLHSQKIIFNLPPLGTENTASFLRSP